MAIVEWMDDAADATSRSTSREKVEPSRRRDLATGSARPRSTSARSTSRRTGRDAASTSEREITLSPGPATSSIARLSTYELNTGLLVLESSFRRAPRQARHRLAATLAEQIALVLQDRAIRAQLQELSERNRERAETLNQILEISNELKKHLNLDNLFQTIVTAAGRSLGFNAVLLSVYEPERNAFVHRAQFGLDQRWEEMKGREIPAAEITRNWTEENRVSKSYHLRERTTGTPTRFDVVTARSARRSGPERAGGPTRRSGSRSSPASGSWVPARRRSARTASRRRSRRSRRSRSSRTRPSRRSRSRARYTDAREQSIRDGLTGAYNHRYFQESLQKEIGRAERRGRPLSVLLLDIDDFKAINDRTGTPSATRSSSASSRRSATRSAATWTSWRATAARSSRVILPETPTDEAAEVAERVRCRIDERLFRPPDTNDVVRVTVSIGVATFPLDARNKKELIDRADSALYRAKRGGKNAVVATSRRAPPGPAHAARSLTPAGSTGMNS